MSENTKNLKNQFLSIESWPRAIIHMDADAFFASCEQAIHPKLKTKPVITGKERGIVAAASYEAKARGIKRGMRISEAQKVCPEAIMLPSDYETYSLFSLRLFEILRRFTPVVEEYSIDEAFADLAGLRQYFRCPYEEMAKKIKDTVEKNLGLTVSIGLSLTKVLAKIGSKYQKPAGFTTISGRDIHKYLVNLPAGQVWGIGPNTSAFLAKLGVTSALDFALKDEEFVKRYFSKPHLEIWHELNGRSIYPVLTEPSKDHQSISKTKTFTPPSRDRNFVFAQLSKNLENACIKARRHKLLARRVTVLLKRQDFNTQGVELKIPYSTAYPVELLGPLKEGFLQIHEPDVLYRATGVVLSGLCPEQHVQYDLFGKPPASGEKISRLYTAMDVISGKFGKHTICHGSSLLAKLQAQHEGKRGDIPRRKKELFKGENQRQRLGLPLLDMEV